MQGSHLIEGSRTRAGERKQAGEALSHNLVGQKLGRKGRDTRERILAAAAELISGAPETPVTLSAVARKASLGMTSLYLYFSDLSQLLVAVLEPIMASAEDSHIAHLREHWPDETLRDHCLAFVRSYHDFWRQHSRILHLRNSMADAYDTRMVQHRISAASPLIELLTAQMNGDAADRESPAYGMATALFTGLDRLIAIRTDTDPRRVNIEPNLRNRLLAQARLLELGIRDGRSGFDFDRLATSIA